MVTVASYEERVKRACYLLRTFNSTGMTHGTTDTGAQLARWGGEGVEFLIEAMREMIGDDPARRALVRNKIEELGSKLTEVLY